MRNRGVIVKRIMPSRSTKVKGKMRINKYIKIKTYEEKKTGYTVTYFLFLLSLKER